MCKKGNLKLYLFKHSHCNIHSLIFIKQSKYIMSSIHASGVRLPHFHLTKSNFTLKIFPTPKDKSHSFSCKLLIYLLLSFKIQKRKFLYHFLASKSKWVIVVDHKWKLKWPRRMLFCPLPLQNHHMTLGKKIRSSLGLQSPRSWRRSYINASFKNLGLWNSWVDQKTKIKPHFVASHPKKTLLLIMKAELCCETLWPAGAQENCKCGKEFKNDDWHVCIS